MIYRRRFGRGLTVGVFAALAVVAVALVAAMVAGGLAGRTVAAAVWLAAFGWTAYWWLLRIPVGVLLELDTLVWDAPLRSGELPVASVTRVRPMRLAATGVLIEHDGGRPLVLPPAPDLRPVLAELSRLRPDLDVPAGWPARPGSRRSPAPGRPIRL
jgi:hypothetical protein